MNLSRPNTGILIVNTFPREIGNILGSSEKSLVAKLGEEFKVRAISALDALDGPIPEQGVILNGSPHSILQDHDWLDQYYRFIKDIAAQGKTVLGVCFGHQGLNKAYDGIVEKVDEAQFGEQKITLTEAGAKHPLFHGVPREIVLPASHFDHITAIPSCGTTLATTEKSRHYAIDIHSEGRGTLWGIQFHPEMNGARLGRVIEMKKGGISNWEVKQQKAIQTDFGSYGAIMIRNYGKAVIRANN